MNLHRHPDLRRALRQRQAVGPEGRKLVDVQIDTRTTKPDPTRAGPIEASLRSVSNSEAEIIASNCGLVFIGLRGQGAGSRWIARGVETRRYMAVFMGAKTTVEPRLQSVF